MRIFIVIEDVAGGIVSARSAQEDNGLLDSEEASNAYVYKTSIMDALQEMASGFAMERAPTGRLDS